MNKKICFVIKKLAGRGGGAERVLADVANEMCRRGHFVDVVTYEPRRVPPFYKFNFGIRLTNLMEKSLVGIREKIIWKIIRLAKMFPYVYPLSLIRWWGDNFPFSRALKRYFEANKPDVVVAWMPPTYAPCVKAIKSIGGNGIRLIASTHNAPEQDYLNPERWDKNPVDRVKRLENLKEMDGFSVLLPQYKEWYAESLKKKATVIANAVLPVSAEKLQSVQREEVVIAVGRLAKVKRHDILIHAWSRLVKDFPSWKLYILGDGPEKNNLQSQIGSCGLGEHVFLLGQKENIEDYYLSASILAHAAEYEGFPLAVTEALAHGLPVIGFETCSGLNQLVKPGINGILVGASGDLVSNFEFALRDLIIHEDKRLNLSEKAPESMSKYKPEDVFSRWNNFIVGKISDDF